MTDVRNPRVSVTTLLHCSDLHFGHPAVPEQYEAIEAMVGQHRDNGFRQHNIALSEALDIRRGRPGILEDVIARAEVIDISKLSGKTAKFGAIVKLADEDTEERVRYQIVGPFEADLSKGKISITAPLGRALIGKGVGDSVEVQTPSGTKSYEVVTVKFK